MTDLTGVTLFFRQKVQTAGYRGVQNMRISLPFLKENRPKKKLDHFWIK